MIGWLAQLLEGRHIRRAEAAALTTADERIDSLFVGNNVLKPANSRSAHCKIIITWKCLQSTTSARRPHPPSVNSPIKRLTAVWRYDLLPIINKWPAVAAQTARSRCKSIGIAYSTLINLWLMPKAKDSIHGVWVITKLYFAIFSALKNHWP